MSGGPIYSEDRRAIVGMSVAKSYNPTVKGNQYSEVAILIPSSVIEAEWVKFKTDSH